MANDPSAGPDAWLGEHLEKWVEAGIVSPEEADAITDYEAREGATGDRAARPGSRRLPVAAEAVSYLGIILVAASGTVVVARFWDGLHSVGRLAVGLVVVLASFAAASVVGRNGDPGSQRLAGFLQLCGTGGVALIAVIVAIAFGSHDPGVNALSAGPPVLVVSVALWRNAERVYPFLAAVAGAAATAVGLHDVVQGGFTPTETGLVVWGTGVALGALGVAQRLHPALTSMLLGEVAAFGGALAVAADHHALGLTLGLATAVVALLTGLASRHTSVETLGVIGSLVFLGYALALYVKGPASAVAILTLGVILVVFAVRAGLHHRTPPPGPRHSPGPPRSGW